MLHRAAGLYYGMGAEHAPWFQHNASEMRINKEPLFPSPCSHRRITTAICLWVLSQNSSVDSTVVSNLKAKLPLSDFNFSRSHAALWLTSSRKNMENNIRETCRQWQSRDKSCLLAFKLGRNSGEEVPADPNSFQMWARWWGLRTAVRWWGLQTQQEAFAQTHDPWHSKLTSSAHTLSKTDSFGVFPCAEKETVWTGSVSLQCTVAYQSWPVKASVAEVAVCDSLSHRLSWQQPWVNIWTIWPKHNAMKRSILPASLTFKVQPGTKRAFKQATI